MSDRLCEFLGCCIGLVIGTVIWWAIVHFAGWEWFAAVCAGSMQMAITRSGSR